MLLYLSKTGTIATYFNTDRQVVLGCFSTPEIIETSLFYPIACCSVRWASEVRAEAQSRGQSTDMLAVQGCYIWTLYPLKKMFCVIFCLKGNASQL